MFWTTHDLFSSFKKWICTLCFDAHFSKFRDFYWWFWDHFNRKNGHFGPLLRDLWQPPLKSHDISAFVPHGPSQNLLKPLKPLFWPLWDPLRGPERLRILDPTNDTFSIWCEIVRNGANMSKSCLSPFKVGLYVNWRLQKPPFYTFDTLFWTPIFRPPTQKCWFVVP